MLLPLIRKWLKKRLDIHLSIIPEYFFEATKDGSLLAQVLLYYHVITAAELQLVEETRDSAVAFENYNNHIREWLARIGMELTESDIHEITHTEGTAAASVFYEVYMKLENKQGSVHLAKTRQHHFKIQKVSEYEMEDVFIEANPLCEPLIKQWDVINWERDHLAAIMMKYLRSREEYDQYLQQKTLKELVSPAYHAKLEDTLVLLKAEKTDYTYDELIEQQKAALEMEQFQPNTDEARRIMKQIKKRNKQRAERTAFRLELQHELMAEVWKRIGETEEQEFDKVVCEKLLKQSKHEKEIAEKLFAIRQHKEEMIQNRKIQDEIDQKRRDEEFIRRLFEESLEERMKFHEERMALIEEHKRLYAEKLRLKALKHQKLCREIMDDIVDIALKTAEYKEMYGVEPDKYVKRNWATLFIKQQPIFDLVVPLQDLTQPPEDTTEELEEIFRREIKRQDILDEQDLYDYIHFRNIWMIEEGLEDFMTPMELGMNCLGYVVHKLLLKKYPLPIPQKPELSPEIEISACTNNMTDLSRLDFLQRLLDLRSVKVIQMEDATNFCIKARRVSEGGDTEKSEESEGTEEREERQEGE
ncbi:hypothetical protein GEV33_000983 [Tenebrio molitor]|uniref:CPC1/SPEF2 domain-containing protein n=1 Tax=Tenebrio molitor TaxID=7067 RepID=A0A8J6HWE3_TENMO|nr:hypothetical protein GEV33_000983 [Tenebrio molitor]